MSIYDDVLECENLFNELCVDWSTGEIDHAQERSLDELKEEIIQQGMERLCKVRANKIADIMSLKSEEKRIAEKRKSIERGMERLEEYMQLIYDRAGGGKITAGTFTVSTRKSTKTIIDDADSLPAKYKVEKIEYKPDLATIKADISAGVEVSGAHLEDCYNLQVK